MRRCHLKKGDRSSAGGVVVEGIPGMTHYGTELTFVGARVECPACRSTGQIVPTGPRWPDNLMGKHAALEGDLCACKCDRPPVMLASQADMFESFEAHELASMGFAPTGRSLDATPDSEHWIKFALSDKGICEGLRCAAHFEDGTVEHGTFDSNSVVHFDRQNGSPCQRVEVLFDDHGHSSGSVIGNLLNAMAG